jgi:subtilisin
VVFVVSAGNDSRDLGKDKVYPCSFNLENVICVGSIDANRKISSYSNYGKGVDVYALGSYEQGRFTGTSFAAPIVTRAIVAMKSKHSLLSYSQIKEKVKKEFYHE